MPLYVASVVDDVRPGTSVLTRDLWRLTRQALRQDSSLGIARSDTFETSQSSRTKRQLFGRQRWSYTVVRFVLFYDFVSHWWCHYSKDLWKYIVLGNGTFGISQTLENYISCQLVSGGESLLMRQSIKMLYHLVNW